MARIVKREKLEGGTSVFYVVTDERGCIGTAHLDLNRASRHGWGRIISRDRHIPIHLPDYPYGTEMECHFVGGKSRCDGSSLFGMEFGAPFEVDEQAYQIAADMIDAEDQATNTE